MDTLTREPSLYERHPELKVSAEELTKRHERSRAIRKKFVEEGDEAEQRETGEFLMKALAEARESNRESRE